MTDEEKSILSERMADYLLVLRTTIRLSQADIAEKIGVSRQTMVAFENKKRPLPWHIFMSLYLLFSNNKNSNQLMRVFGITTDELLQFVGIEETEED